MSRSDTAEATEVKNPKTEPNKAPEAQTGTDNTNQNEAGKGSDTNSIAQASAQAYAPGTDANSSIGRDNTTKVAEGKLPNFFPDLKVDYSSDKNKEVKETKETGYKNPNMSEEGQALVRQAEKAILKPGYPNAGKELLKFAQDVETFEKTARENGLGPEEVKNTYKGINDLLRSSSEPGNPGVTGDGMKSERQRVRVAEQLMNMVAHPEDRSQGSFGTCAMATAEGMLLTGKNADPSKVTKMVSEVALTGKTEVGGLTVKLDRQSMQSFGEHADNRDVGVDKQRLAENIFRLTAANTYYAMMKEEGKAEGQLQYVSRKDGNHLIYKRDESLPHDANMAKQFTLKDGDTSPGEAATLVNESRILNRITGKDYKERMVQNGNIVDGDEKWVTQVKSQQELDAHLKQVKENGGYPVTLTVYAGNPPFSDASNPFKAMDKTKSTNDIVNIFKDVFFDAHSILLTDRKEGPRGPEYPIKNTWGADSNVTANQDTVYTATLPVKASHMAENIDKWHQESNDKTSEGHLGKLAVSLLLTSLEIDTRRRNTPEGANPALERDLQSAQLRLHSVYQGLPQADRTKIEREMDKALKQQSPDPQTKELLQKLWGQIVN